MRVLFFMAHDGFARNFEWVLREFAARGHDVVVGLDDRRGGGSGEADPLCTIAEECPSVSVVSAPPPRRASAWAAGVAARRWLDALTYYDPRREQLARLRRRAFAAAPGGRAAERLGLLATPRGRRAAERAARLLDRAVHVRRPVRRLLREAAPDVVLVTPLVELGAPQAEYVRAAADAGLPTALLLASWDNLTVKGRMHVLPDLVAVWNDIQRREAVELHGVPVERVVVTGAVAYDHWFDWRPATTRGEFCRQIGLDPERPFVVYAGSSSFVAPDEGAFVREWLEALRRVSPAAAVQVLVRPHPLNPLGPALDALARSDGVVVHPQAGANPVDPHARAVYFDTLYHAVAVVGVNTSAFVESAVIGRPTYAVLADRYRGSQELTLHFRYLLPAAGGVVQAAALPEHVDRLAELLAGVADPPDPRAFVESFVRPRGLETPTAPVLVHAVEELAAGRMRSAAAAPAAAATR